MKHCINDALPGELLARIIRLSAAQLDAATTAEEQASTQRHLATCMLVCRQWRALAACELYRHPQCQRKHQLDSLLHTVSTAAASANRTPSEYARLVQTLTFGHFASRAVDDGFFRRLVRACGPSLRHLNVVGLTRVSGDAVLDAVSVHCLQLRHLAVDDHPEQPRYSAAAWQLFFASDAGIKLRAVELYRCSTVTDAALAPLLATNSHLRHLVLMECAGVTDVSVGALVRHCLALHTVRITSRHMHDHQLLHRLASRCRRVHISTVSVLSTSLTADNDGAEDALHEAVTQEQATLTRQCRMTRAHSRATIAVEHSEYAMQSPAVALFG